MAKKEKKQVTAETKKYRINLNPVKRFPLKKRAKRAPLFIRRFVHKNTRVPLERIFISGELNEAVWARGISNIPNKMDLEVLLEEGNARVFLKDSKAIASYLEEKKAAEKKKKEEKEKKEAEKKETGEEKKEAEEKEKIDEQKKEEKHLKEKYSEALEIKRQ